ncbi:MAG: NifU family protein [Candidatus Altiarchaeota archaeon]|nr:NifU family protein [Candidatus Altiarchaeota archaeon]
MDTKKRVEKALDKVRLALQIDGGDIKLVDVKDNVVKVKLQGSCAGCPMAQMTLKALVETAVKKEAPEIVKVEAV